MQISRIGLLSLILLTLGCDDATAPFAIGNRVRVVVASMSSDSTLFNINGDEFQKQLQANSTDRFYATLRFRGAEQEYFSVSVKNLRTGKLSQTIQCPFQVGRVATLEYSEFVGSTGYVRCWLNYN